MNINGAARLWLQKNFIDSAEADLRSASVVMHRGAKVIKCYQDKGRVSIVSGKEACVYSGITSVDAPILVSKVVSSGDSPVKEFTHIYGDIPFKYPTQFKSCVLYPEDATSEGAVYRDFGGRRYIHQEDARISLMLYKGLYDRNRESEMLLLPELYPYEGQVFSKKLQPMSFETIRGAMLSLYDIDTIDNVDKRSIPSRRKCSLLENAKQSFEFVEVVSDSDFMFKDAGGNTLLWSDIVNKYNLRSDISQCDTIKFF
jgi:hypothetical protein